MFKKLLRDYLTGKVRFQPFFERLHKISLAGMNYGKGYDVRFSGEILVLKYLAQCIEKDSNPIVFDVGANIGEYGLEVLSYLNKPVQLYCFEPSKEAYASLSRKLGQDKKTKIYNFGFGEEEALTILRADVAGSRLGSVFLRRLDHFGIEMPHIEEIRLRRLDKFCQENGIHRIKLLKLDVEGNELKVLKGAERLIESGAIDYIQFEFGGCNIDSRTYFQDFFYLLNPRYQINRIVKDGFVPIDKYTELHELFITTNYLAILRRHS